MASYSNIPSALLVLLLLLFLSPPFIHQAHNLVAADYQLILDECHNSDTPVTCIRCVKSAPGADKADKIGIATIVINCISYQAKTLVTNMTGLASEEKDHKLKSVYQDCAGLYSTAAKNDLPKAKQALQNHKYDNAEELVVKALNQDVSCQKRLKSYQSRVPVEIVNKTLVYEELSEAACRIIERF